MPGKTVVFLGMSGVGKSSLLNALMEQDVMKVQAIRELDAGGGTRQRTVSCSCSPPVRWSSIRRVCVSLGYLMPMKAYAQALPIGSTRLAYIKFNLEFCVLYVSMAVSGMVLAALTMQLFSFIDLDIEEFYFSNIVLFGAAALAIVAAYQVSMNLKLAKNITPYIAKIFSPLVLVTLLVYLITVIWVGKNPFLDRNFLIAFNGILLGVLAVTIFSITESDSDEKKNISDYINFFLIFLALIIDSVALSSIVFRLSSYGITPNRLAVLGVNILIWGNLIWIMVSYMRFLQNKTGPSPIQEAVTKYLPVYGLWAAFVTFTFPFFFN